MSIHRLGFLSILLFLVLTIKGQELKFENITTKDGLLSDEVYNLHQDRQGYIWVFTNYGAMKYNGTSFKPVLQNLKFEDAFIYSIYENAKGEKWVANSQARIFKVRNDSAFVIPGIDSVSAHLRGNVNEIMQLHVDDSLNIYAITKQLCFKFINRGDHYVPTLLNNLFREADSLTFLVIKRGESFLPLFRFQSERQSILDSKRPVGYLAIEDESPRTRYRLPMDGIVNHFRRANNHEAYFNAFKSLYHVRDGVLKKVHRFPAFVTNFSINSDSSVWVGQYNGGIIKIDKNDSVVAHYLPGITVNYILFDTQMGIWASTPGQGLYHCVDKKQVSFSSTHPLAKNISMLKVIGDSIFIGTSGAVFACANGAPAHLFDHSSSFDLLDMTRLGEDFLFGFRDQAIVVSLKKGKAVVRPFYEYASNPFHIVYASYDSAMMVHRKGIAFVGRDRLKKRIDVDLKTYDALLRDDHLLLATADGIHTIDLPFPSLPDTAKVPLLDVTLNRPSYLSLSENMLVTRIVKGPEGVIWFCTTGNGILELDQANKLRNYTTADGLPSNFINHLSFSEEGLVLISANNGHFIARRSPGQSLRNVKWKRTYYGKVNCSEVFHGKLYIGSRTGLVIRTSFKYERGKTFYFNLTGVRVHEQPVPESQLEKLSYADNDLEFNYDFIDFTSGQPELYFRLEGKYSDSGNVLGNNLRFQNLRPGRYTLFVYPKVNDGEKLGIRTKFVLRPAVWQRTWFIIIMILLSTLLTAGIAWYGFRLYKFRQAKREEAERLILEYKLIAIKAQVNPHFVSNCLTAIQHLIINNRVEAATRYIAKFGFLVRQILNFSTRALVTLGEELEITKLNIELEQLRFDQKFRFDLEIEEGIEAARTFVPSLILNPLVENAIWHGLLPLRAERQGRLLIRVRIIEGRLLIDVEDNGVGRKKAGQSFGNTRESKGLKLATQRLANINYLYQRNDSELRFTDLTGENGVPLGTRVTIVLPLDLKPLKNERDQDSGD